MKSQKTRLIIMILIIVVSCALAAISFIILPDTLITQLSVSGSNPTMMPKLPALIIPFLLSVIFSIAFYTSKNSEVKMLVVSLVGIAVQVLAFVINI